MNSTIEYQLKPVRSTTTRFAGLLLVVTGMSNAAVTSILTTEAVSGNGQASPVTTTVSGSDLLQGPEFLSASLDAPLIGGHDVDALRDGSWGNGQDGSGNTAIAFGNGNSVEFFLDTTLSPLGYDLSSIVVSSWWSTGGSGRTEHIYSVSISYINDPAFVELAPLTHFSPANLSPVTQVTLADLLNGTNPATGVDGIRFDFGGNPVSGEGANGANFIREIDINGSAVLVPEPGSLLLLGISSTLLLIRRRRN